ncbi:hypothetical protein CJ030_MR6G010839 [Morella rubra]|uniref:Reverse transcriptase domain-containing protein n=1 Tax=Morella rubra TaxID=262757 RepID=A0A6A1VCR5_9ROSI|nr:hypothetical protein CJ030_MR6G010839 [Morella rubra]
MLCKLDVHKAYDHVNWSFLLYMLRRCGFGVKWCRWIEFCISAVKYSVIVNDTPEDFFSGTLGLRQGDPLSPFLFILVMVAFSRMLNKLVEIGAITGFNVERGGHHGVCISHLLFVDDTLILCGDEENQFRNLRCLLLCFEAVFGLKINLAKSELIPIGAVGNVEELAGILGCRVSSLPITYGLPLGARFKSIHIWDDIIERTERRLAGWKQCYLSKGGRVTLIKSILVNLPTYFLSLFPLSSSVACRLEKLQRDFLWGSNENVHKFHLLKWDKVCCPIRNGGLAIRRLTTFNKALLGKWL